MTTQSYKTIFLDWDGTLCRSRFWGQWAIGERAGLYQEIQSKFFGGQPEFLSRWMRGGETAETCAALVSELTGQESSIILSGLEEGCRAMAFAADQVPILIGELRRAGAKVVLATDNMDTFRRWTVPGLGLEELADDILDSWSLKALKADTLPTGESAFFSTYMPMVPGESVLVDDSKKAKAVEAFGIDLIPVNAEQGIVEVLESLLKAGDAASLL